VKRVYRDLYEALSNDSFRVLFVGTLIYFIYAGTQGALSMHLMTFYWQLDTTGIQWIQYAGLIGAICGVPLAPQFNRWFDKKWTVIVGVSVGALTDTVPVLLKLVGAMPENQATLVYILIPLSSLGSFFGVQASITVASMMGDVADEHELKHGTRQEGVYFGSYSFSQKCTGALGNFMAGVAIDMIGLNPNSKVAKCRRRAEPLRRVVWFDCAVDRGGDLGFPAVLAQQQTARAGAGGTGEAAAARRGVGAGNGANRCTCTGAGG
jgi:Na+/melibiose symporter-like transporter